MFTIGEIELNSTRVIIFLSVCPYLHDYMSITCQNTWFTLTLSAPMTHPTDKSGLCGSY